MKSRLLFLLSWLLLFGSLSLLFADAGSSDTLRGAIKTWLTSTDAKTIGGTVTFTGTATVTTLSATSVVASGTVTGGTVTSTGALNGASASVSGTCAVTTLTATGTVQGAAVVTSSVSAGSGDLTLTGRSAATTLNQAGDEALSGFTATSLVGALNELKAAGGGTASLASTLAVGATTGGTDITFTDGDLVQGDNLVVQGTTSLSLRQDSVRLYLSSSISAQTTAGDPSQIYHLVGCDACVSTQTLSVALAPHVYTNAGSTAALTLTLPGDPSPGVLLTFVRIAANDFWIRPGSGGRIIYSGGTMSNDEAINLVTMGAKLQVCSDGYGGWVATGEHGTLTEEAP